MAAWWRGGKGNNLHQALKIDTADVKIHGSGN